MSFELTLKKFIGLASHRKVKVKTIGNHAVEGTLISLEKSNHDGAGNVILKNSEGHIIVRGNMVTAICLGDGTVV